MKPYHRLARHYGNETLFEMVEMSIISTLWNDPLHIHAEGLRGTGKTTIMRAAKNVLPPIERIKNCLYNCDPKKPHCPQHAGLTPEQIAEIGTEWIPMPYLEISHSAKIGTVVGSIDLAKITDPTQPTAAILPGVVPQAHRGIIFVDEINRLADTSPEITDVLLDVMGTKPGRIQIEEAGIPLVQIPVQVSIWAASNPDEEPGPLEEIRKQLSDRFDLVLYMGRPNSLETVADILLQSEMVRFGQIGSDGNAEEDLKILKRFQKIAEENRGVGMPDFLRNFIARIYLKYHVESLRAIEGIQQAAVLHTVLKERKQVLVSDIIKVLPLALKHRVEVDTLTKIMNNLDKGDDGGFLEASRREPTAGSFDDGRRGGKGLKSLFGSRDSNKASDMAERDNPESSNLLKARRLSDLGRDELLRTEKDLRPPER